MGRTLLGVDLEESPTGGLVERLLTDDELEKLSDGGRPDDGRGDDGRGGEAPTGGDSEADSDDDADAATADEPDVPGGTRGSARQSRGAARFEPAGVESGEPGDETDAGGLRERLARFRPLLLKAAVALVALAVLALVAWRYLGRVADALPVSVPTPDRFGGGSDDTGTGDATADDVTGTDTDVSQARRRARAQETGGRADGVGEGASGGDRPGEESAGDGADVRTVGGGVDLGALVGLATLALIAALVRKFGEEREHDPLVDGPGRE